VNDSEATADLVPVVICVNETGLAISLELTLQVLGLTAIIHDACEGLGALPLADRSTLIVDRGLLPRNPNPFFARLREQCWRGLAVILIEDSALPEPVPLHAEGTAVLEKPFVAWDLLSLIHRGSGQTA
jgi:hypothetical protein